MAHLRVDEQKLTVVLSRWEKAGAIRMSDVVVPLSSVREVTRLENARDAIRGVRAPGTGLPGVIALGTWRIIGSKDFVAATRNEAGYLIELEGEHFDRLIVSSGSIAELDALAGL